MDYMEFNKRATLLTLHEAVVDHTLHIGTTFSNSNCFSRIFIIDTSFVTN